MSEAIADHLPAPPRPLNARARRRSWAEAPVRTWMVLTILAGGILAYLAGTTIHSALGERRMILNGTPVTATIITIDDGMKRAVKMKGAPNDRTVTLNYPGMPANARARELESMSNDGRREGDKIQIHVDANNPGVWTDRMEPRPWIEHLAVVLLLLPALILAIVMLLVRRRQMLGIWSQGTPMVGQVVDVRQSSLAPRSRVVRFTLEGSTDKRIHSTLFPMSAGAINKGDELLMLASPTNHARAVVAELYEMRN